MASRNIQGLRFRVFFFHCYPIFCLCRKIQNMGINQPPNTHVLMALSSSIYQNSTNYGTKNWNLMLIFNPRILNLLGFSAIVASRLCRIDAIKRKIEHIPNITLMGNAPTFKCQKVPIYHHDSNTHHAV